MMIHTYTRRSKNDDGKQEYSLDVQAMGCRDWVLASRFAASKVASYVDDGISGDDFVHRDDLRRLLTNVKPGDVVACRDGSRLGRDALETTLVIRDLVRDRGCRLFYYETGREVLMETAIDQAMTFFAATGHQMELEAIRSRVTEALRMRVRSGRVAGGRCYGYRNERIADGGRSYTVAVIDEEQAQIVRQIYAWRCEGWGFKRIAHALNRGGVPFPKASRRSTGTWTPSAIRAMLFNVRYRGLHVHGRSRKQRRAGVVTRIKADPASVLTVERPEWRIVDDALWLRAQDESALKAPRHLPSPRCKYPLTAIGRCAFCGGSIGVANAGRQVKSYVCIQHRERGAAVCPVQIYQPTAEVERSLVAFIDRHVLSPEVIATVASEIRAAIESQLPDRNTDAGALEVELRQVKAEQKRLAEAVALADNVPELVAVMRDRVTRARDLEVQIATIRRAPAELAALVDQAEASVKERLGKVRTALLGEDPADLRQAFARLFPDGVQFHPTQVGTRKVWQIKGAASIGRLASVPEDRWFSSDHAPTGPPPETPKAVGGRAGPDGAPTRNAKGRGRSAGPDRCLARSIRRS